MTAGQHPDGFRDYLRSIPDSIARHEADGHPIVVEMPPTLPLHAQRLLATLGCLIRFRDDAPEPRFRQPVAPRRRRQGRTWRAILDLLADGRSRTTPEISDAIGARRDTTGHVLRSLVDDGLVERPKRGIYRARQRRTPGVREKVGAALEGAAVDDPLAARTREWLDGLEPAALD